jgi:hypothetical protein
LHLCLRNVAIINPHGLLWNDFPYGYTIWAIFLTISQVILPASWWSLSDDDGWWWEDATELWMVNVFPLYLYQWRNITYNNGRGRSADRVGWEVWESVELGWLQWNVEGNERCRGVQTVQGHFFSNSSSIYMMLVRSRGQTLSH